MLNPVTSCVKNPNFEEYAADRLTSALGAGDGVGVGAALGGVVAASAEAVEEPLGAQDPAARDGP